MVISATKPLNQLAIDEIRHWIETSALLQIGASQAVNTTASPTDTTTPALIESTPMPTTAPTSTSTPPPTSIPIPQPTMAPTSIPTLIPTEKGSDGTRAEPETDSAMPHSLGTVCWSLLVSLVTMALFLRPNHTTTSSNRICKCMGKPVSPSIRTLLYTTIVFALRQRLFPLSSGKHEERIKSLYFSQLWFECVVN